MKNYEIIIKWNTEDEIFVAEIPELKGCIAHGETEQEALDNIIEAKELWLKTAKEFGDTIPEPKAVSEVV